MFATSNTKVPKYFLEKSDNEKVTILQVLIMQSGPNQMILLDIIVQYQWLIMH